jgi:hypothetical protein
LRQDAVATYQKKFDNSAKSWSLNSTIITTPMILNWPLSNSASTLANSSNQNFYNFKFDYSQPIKFSDEGN